MIPKLDDELYRMTDHDFVCIVTKGQVLFFNNDAPGGYTYLSDIQEAGWDSTALFFAFAKTYHVQLTLRDAPDTIIRCPSKEDCFNLCNNIKMAMMLS